MAAHELLISTNTEALMDRNGFGAIPLVDNLPPELQILALLVAYCLLMAVSTLRVFEKRDNTTGS